MNRRWTVGSVLCIVACAALTAGALEKAGNPDRTRVVKEMRVIGPVEFARATAKTASEAAALGGKSYEVTLGADETMVDLVKLTGYRPPVLAIGQGADRCGYVVFSVEAERAGRMTLFVANDWWGQLHVNGRLVGERGGGWNPVADTISYCCTWSPLVFEARKGANELLFRTRPGSCGRWICAFAVGADDCVDFSRAVGTMRREVHSASWGPRSSDRGNIEDDADLKALKLHGWRSHDAPLVSTGQRVVDTHFVFPLLHLDAKDPKNYFFEATDHLFDLVEGCDMKVFYRLGTSIEHSGEWGCNTLDPPDHAKYAEVLAGIVRHYTQGWGGGKKRDIRYWELFNEPDVPPCWRGSYEAFIDLFVTCLKRLKAEFPDLRIGGPAMGSFKTDWFDRLLDACAKANVKPDFISFHHYSPRPAELVEQPWVARRYLDARGLTDCGIVINEWHYLPESGFNGLQMSDSVERFIRAHTGPDGIIGADSAAFAAGVSSGFQATPIAQSYYYGCGYQWDWGYRDTYRRLNKPYYAMKMVGELVANYPTRVAVEPTTPNLFLLAGKSTSGGRAAVLVTDYRGKGTTLDIGVKGLEGWRIASVTRLDQESDDVDALGDATFADGRLVLRKPAPGSTVYLVSFVRPGCTDHSDSWKPKKPWHGFNLLGLFRAPWNRTDARAQGFCEEHFKWMSEWGFDFARLPMDYRNFVSTNDWSVFREEGFKEVDKAVAWGRKYGIHVQPCLHRAPGFTIASWDAEPRKLQTDPVAQKAFCAIWAAFAKRYCGIPNEELSFNLVNEPYGFTTEQYVRVFGDAIKAIRAEDPDRFVMLDGNNTASTPVDTFFSVKSTGQAFRGYTPHAISHYGAWYIKDQPKSEPAWPIAPSLVDGRWIFEMPEKTLEKFDWVAKRGYPVMIGEFGCYNKISHETCLKWMEHCLKLWKERNLGWALWNLDGAFGILDSGRTDVDYEDFHGHKLDRKMLDLLLRYAR